MTNIQDRFRSLLETFNTVVDNARHRAETSRPVNSSRDQDREDARVHQEQDDDTDEDLISG